MMLDREITITGSESGNLTSGNVGFNDAANDDFSLQASSVCINAGTNSGSSSFDVNGNQRVLGGVVI